MIGVGALLAIAGLGAGTLFGVPPVNRAMTYFFNKHWKNAEFTVNEAVELWWRGIIDDKRLDEVLSKYGIGKDKIEAYKQLARKLLGANDLLELLYRGVIDEKTYKEKMKQLGYEEEDSEFLIKLRERLYGAGDLIEMKFRGVISEEEFYSEMAKLGFKKERAEKLVEIAKYLPSPSDFIRFAVRDVFNEHIVKKYGYDEEFPEGIVPYAAKAGMDRETLLWYWRAHWELPSPTMGFEMLHRLNPEVLNTPTVRGGRIGDKYAKMGLDPNSIQTDLDTLRELLKVADYPKYWRDRILAISYYPLTRVDLRRIYQLGLIDETELKGRLMELGYSSEDAELMVEFYKAYKLGTEKELSKSEILRLYRLKAIKREEAKDMLMSLGYDDNEAEYLLALEDYKYYQEWLEQRVKTLQLRFIRGVITENEFVDALNKLGLPSEQASVYYEEALRKREQAEKMPSKADLVNMFKAGVITVGEFREYMKRLGYSEFWVDKYLKMLGVS